MLSWVYRVNRWYDDLDDTHPVARMFLFIIPLMIFDLIITWPNKAIALAGCGGLGFMVFLRVTPIFIPRGGR
jgi:hypothetical protein